jgi:thiol:disulfide interchange protein DsbD
MGLFALSNYALTPKVRLTWLTSEEAAVQTAHTARRPMVVDFMADWCLPCKELDVKVFAHRDIARDLGDFVLLRIDLSREDEVEALGRLKDKYGVATLPAVRFVAPDGRIVARVDSLISVEEFRNLLARARS